MGVPISSEDSLEDNQGVEPDFILANSPIDLDFDTDANDDSQRAMESWEANVVVGSANMAGDYSNEDKETIGPKGIAEWRANNADHEWRADNHVECFLRRAHQEQNENLI